MRPSRLVLSALLSLITFLAATPTLEIRDADADSCVVPGGIFAPPTDTVLPARGVIYLFIPTRSVLFQKSMARKQPALPKDLRVIGATSTLRTVESSHFAEIVRIDYQASAPQISFLWRLGDIRTSVTYPIGEPAPARATVVAVAPKRLRTSCVTSSTTLGIELKGNAIAYRLAWADGTTTWLPPNAIDQPTRTSPAQLFLGEVGCIGHSVPAAQLATLREFRLFALFADGTERAFRPARAMLREGDDLRLPLELVGATARSLDDPEPPSVESLFAYYHAELRGWQWPLLATTLVASLVLLLQLLEDRRRDHKPRR